MTLLLAGMHALAGNATRKVYLYTYYDKQGRIVINNLPPSFVQGQGFRLKSVGVGHIRLAITKVEMAKVLRSPEMLSLVDEIATQEGVDPWLARAVIQAESAFNYKARSHAGALGLMQLIPATAERFGVLDPFDPKQNITGGCKYLKWLANHFKGDLTKVVAAYNAGERAVAKHNGIPPFAETQAYVPRVLDLFRRKAVIADPKASGAMDYLKKGRGGFQVDSKPLPKEPERAAATPESTQAPPPPIRNTQIYRWTGPDGRVQISDTPPVYTTGSGTTVIRDY